MKNNEIIKQAQAECGEYVTGYKADVNIDNLQVIMEKIWHRCVNLSYTFQDFRLEMSQVIGTKAYTIFLVDILDFMQGKMDKQKYFNFNGVRYCA